MLPSRSALADNWALDPRTVFLNHGSFGACSRPVLRAQAKLRARLERQPVRFLARDLDGLLVEARAELASFVGADPDDIVFVPNATHGIATVLRSLRFRPGDELLISDHAYNAAANAVRFAAERDGGRLVVASIPFPSAGPDEVIERVLDTLTPRTRLAVLSHVTSPTALILPIERLAGELTARGVEVLVDGAHAPGMIDLDLRALGRAGVAYYTGNGHKWLGAPKGSAFLWVRPDRQTGIRPLAISHGANSTDATRSRFRLEADWTGTPDPTPWLAIPAAIRFLGSLRPDGWPGLMAAGRSLVLTGRDALLERLDVAAPAPADMIGSLASILLPIGKGQTGASQALSPLDEDPLQRQLRERFAIEVPVLPWPQVWAAPDARPGRLIRISAAPYDSAAEYRYLAEALAELLGP